jgi:hypothetical protein
MFGMSQHTDRLADVSWMGPEYADMGWFVVGELPVRQRLHPLIFYGRKPKTAYAKAIGR